MQLFLPAQFQATQLEAKEVKIINFVKSLLFLRLLHGWLCSCIFLSLYGAFSGLVQPPWGIGAIGGNVGTGISGGGIVSEAAGTGLGGFTGGVAAGSTAVSVPLTTGDAGVAAVGAGDNHELCQECNFSGECFLCSCFWSCYCYWRWSVTSGKCTGNDGSNSRSYADVLPSPCHRHWHNWPSQRHSYQVFLLSQL